MGVVQCTLEMRNKGLYGAAVSEEGIFLYAKIPEKFESIPGINIAINTLYGNVFDALLGLNSEPATGDVNALFDMLNEVYLIESRKW